MTDAPCDGCARVALGPQSPHFIHEFPSSFLFLGDHQYYAGYSVLMLKRHEREWTSLGETERGQMFRDLDAATRALEAAFRPWKMNHACLGNLLQHVHWHLMPRYEQDPDRFHNPWFNMGKFSGAKPADEVAKSRIDVIRRKIHEIH